MLAVSNSSNTVFPHYITSHQFLLQFNFFLLICILEFFLIEAYAYQINQLFNSSRICFICVEIVIIGERMFPPRDVFFSLFWGTYLTGLNCMVCSCTQRCQKIKIQNSGCESHIMQFFFFLAYDVPDSQKSSTAMCCCLPV